MTWLRRLSVFLGSAVLLLIVVPFLFCAWLLFTNAGANWVAQRALPYVPASITYADIDGNLWSGLEVRQLAVQAHGEDLGFESISAGEFNFEWQPLGLLTSRIQLNSVLLKQADVRLLEPSATSQAPSNEPFRFPVVDLPFNIEIQSLNVRSVRLLTSNTIDHIPDLDAQVWMGGDQLVLSKLNFTYDTVDYGLSGRVKFGLDPVFNLKVPSHGISLAGNCRSDSEISCNAELAWKNFSHPITGDMKTPNGNLKLALVGQQLSVSGEGDFIWPYEYSPIDTHGVVKGVVDFEKKQALIHSLSAGYAGGEAQIDGSLNWNSDFSLDLNVAGKDVSLAHWLPQELSESKADLQARVTLSVPTDGVYMQVQVPSISANFGAKPIHGSLVFDLNPSSVAISNLNLTGAGSEVSGQAKLGFDESILVLLNVSSRQLNSLVPELSGDVNLALDAKGSLVAPSIKVDFKSDELNFDGWQVEALSVYGEVGANKTSQNIEQSLGLFLSTLSFKKFDVGAKKITVDAKSVGGAEISLVGGLKSHLIQFSGSDLVGHFDLPVLRIKGGFNFPIAGDLDAILNAFTWQGSIDELNFNDGFHENYWQLRAPSRGVVSLGKLEWQPLCLTQANLEVCLEKSKITQWQNFDLAGSVQGFFLDREKTSYPGLYSTLPEEWLLKGELFANWRLSAQLDQGLISKMAVVANIDSRNMEMIYAQGEEPSLSLPIENFQLSLAGDEKQLQLQGDIAFDKNQTLTMSGSALNWQQAERSLMFNVKGGIGQFAYLQPFFPSQRDLQGAVAADITVTLPPGSNQLSYQGQLLISNAGLFNPSTGTELKNWEILLQAEQGDLLLNANGKVGEGFARVDGKVLAKQIGDKRLFQAELGISGSNLQLVNLPDIQLRANPTLAITGDGKRWHLSGDVRVHDSAMLLRELPVSASRVSEDAHIYGREQEANQSALLELTSDVVLGFDNNVAFEGFGLTANVEGDIRFRRDELRLNQAHGIVLVKNGRFRSYGQKLDIDNGRIIFSGPIDNPALSVLALRNIDDDVIVGIKLTGNAKHPKSELYSEKAMSEADILSYIVSGKPISQSGAGEVVDMQSAALGLGLKQALPVLQRIGGEFGLSDISVEEHSSGGSSIAAGKRVSDKLYIKYVYGLLGAAGDFVMQYKLTDRLSIESTSGMSQAIDMTYRWDSEIPTATPAAKTGGELQQSTTAPESPSEAPSSEP